MPSLTLAEARQRAAQLSQVSYDLELDLTRAEDYRSTVTVRFTSGAGDTFLELHRALRVELSVDGEPVDPAYDGSRLRLDALSAGAHEVVVDATMPYVSDGEGMHTFTDPVDGARYAGAYLGLDITQRVFACFDQLDLKAPITLRVVADPAWTVLSNARPTWSEGGRTEFAATQRIPCDLFAVAAGPYHSVVWEHRGLPMGWHARASLAAELDRDAGELRRVTEVCFDHYTGVFDEPFPFDSYDQVFVPELNWGAMECPGCVTFNEGMLPRGRVTDDDRRRRAMVIAHEMSHMWFADLVSPVWWEDAWLNESFADYMGFEVAEAVAGYAGTRVGFEGHYKCEGYLADRRRSTHPVAPLAEDVPDVDTGTTIFDDISYAKGNAVVRQLVTWLGTEDFLAGINAHLTRHRFANATLADLVEALDAASPRDVRSWAGLWLRRSGHDTIRVTRDGDTPVLVREGIRPHRFTVSAYTPQLEPVTSLVVDLDDEPLALPDLAGLVVVPNSYGETFARIALDEASYAAVARGLTRLPDPLVRAVLWAMVLDRVPPTQHLDLLARQLPLEPSPTLVAAAIDRTLGDLVRTRLTPAAVPAALQLVAEACSLEGERDEQRAVALAPGYLVATRDAAQLQRWLGADATDEGVALDPALRWSVVRRLAELGALSSKDVAAELARDQTADGELGAATALAARPTPGAKSEAWASMTADPAVSVRRFQALARGLWSLEHRELVAPYVERYLAAAPALAARGSAFAAAVGSAFPAMPLTHAELDQVRAALRGDVPVVLRRAWEDQLDDREA